MKRVLCIVSGMDRGGAETFLMKVYRKLDRSKYQLDFCVSKENCFYDEEILNMGGKIFFNYPKSKNFFKSFFGIVRLVKRENYEIVLRISQHSLATLDLLAAKIGGAKRLVYRSSNAGIVGGKLKKIINNMFSFLPRVVPNVKVAPSLLAAEFVFGKKAVSKGEVFILKNGLNYSDFSYNNEIRHEIRKKLNIEDKIVFGHIGRFNYQKNHDFLIDIFNEIHKINSNICLLLIGEGELVESIKEKVKKLNLVSSIKFLGVKKSVSDYLMAFDLMLFPSFFEGMPNVIIESQASGLKCLISDTITNEANITGLVKYCSLDCDAVKWANLALEMVDYERKSQEVNFKKNGYLIDEIVLEFIKIVFGVVE